uniref:Uncharacterized protein n=1 Tax=Physcomitrium patens TaxID=3218 RepID=A0A7I3ZLL6_PHYPA
MDRNTVIESGCEAWLEAFSGTAVVALHATQSVSSMPSATPLEKLRVNYRTPTVDHFPYRGFLKFSCERDVPTHVVQPTRKAMFALFP